MTDAGIPLFEALGARAGIVCAVGAGGKKSTLYRIAAEHPGRVGLTATTRTARFPPGLEAHIIIAAAGEIGGRVVAAAAEHRVVAFAPPEPERRARVGGLEPEAVAEIHRRAAFDITLVKADGARVRLIKAPAPGEPVIPSGTGLVVPVVSAKAIGAALAPETAHRIERISALTGARPGEQLTPEHVARLLAHPQGALQNSGSARVVPLINMVDDAKLEARALETAQIALELTERFDRIVLASLRAPEPVVRVVAAARRPGGSRPGGGL